ncbi:ABC transporter ATP-binding protein [Pontibacillus halophilus JSM 076056 = DSM 19796]|uniref:ABC transporter ATP-binding protein n=1 Tax=Pontibacillus halophilus JSM 076056 = DSM 19796 TaxID=1385510 RepID=A0A0A5GR53_9BACI|nr:thiol reductant ABC exporter subunit CydD [Pontibacillus halophilus]KGX93733.1 ABC transporter ATP-binding protein [Pontibacillus halophilus JSM 076056 = DSM 19796]
MNRLNEIARHYRGTQLFLFVIGLLIGGSVIGQAYFFVEVVDGIFFKGETLRDVAPYLAGLAGTMLLRSLLTYVHGRTGVKLGSRVKRYFRKTLLAKFSKSPVHASIKGQSGQKVSVMMDAVDEVDSYFSQYIPQVVQTSIIPLVILIATFSLHVNSALIMLITAPLVPLFYAIIGMKTQEKSEEQLEELSSFSGSFLDTLQGLTTLRLYGQSRKQKETIETSSHRFRDATMEVLKIAFTSSLMLEFISMLSIGLIALEISFRLVGDDTMTFYTAFFILILAPEYYLSLKSLGQAFHTGRTSLGAAEKIYRELEADDEVTWGEKTLQVEEPPRIELQNLSFSYDGEARALKDVEARIEPYQNVAIIGRSGAGKTTMLHLLSGLAQPTSGQILVNGEPLLNYEEHEWLKHLSYISQHPYLFSGTLYDNIVIGAGREATQDEVFKAAESAGLTSLIEELPDGLDTTVGEGGRGLSGGEKQRVALARAFLKRPSIVLFDEPTTGLDLDTERILQQSIHELSKKATVITVAHRLYTIKDADAILLLEAGELVAEGTHDALMNDSDDYRAMVSVQRGGTS